MSKLLNSQGIPIHIQEHSIWKSDVERLTKHTRLYLEHI